MKQNFVFMIVLESDDPVFIKSFANNSKTLFDNTELVRPDDVKHGSFTNVSREDSDKIRDIVNKYHHKEDEEIEEILDTIKNILKEVQDEIDKKK